MSIIKILLIGLSFTIAMAIITTIVVFVISKRVKNKRLLNEYIKKMNGE